MSLEHKSLTATLDEKGSVEAEFSVFDVEDRDGDIVTAAALQPFNGKSLPMVWAHDWSAPVGKGLLVVSEKSAIFKGDFLKTPRGVEAYETVKQMDDLQQWSWGFRTTDYAWEKRDGKNVRVIKGVEPFEVSPVLVGANPYTSTLAVKAAEQISVEDALGVLMKATEIAGLHDLVAHVKDLHGETCELGEECPFAVKQPAPLTERERQRAEIDAMLAKVKL